MGLVRFPTFRIGDHLLVDKISKTLRRRHLQRRDVVVFHPPKVQLVVSSRLRRALFLFHAAHHILL